MASQVQADTPQERPAAENELGSALVEQLRLLRTMPPPAKLAKAAHWRPVVNDALRIAREGWAAKALALGWSIHDLFGVGPVDDWEFAGLAVWLAGRPLVSLDVGHAFAEAGNGVCSVFVRGGPGHGIQPTIAPVLLWEFGR